MARMEDTPDITLAETVIERLSGGDLRSDGRADEVAESVIGDPGMFPILVTALNHSDDVIRARAAHAMEKVSRVKQGAVKAILPRLIDQGASDAVPMVRWHIAMILGNLRYEKAELGTILEALYRFLGDSSTFVRNWAIVSLCVLARKHEEHTRAILEKIAGLSNDEAASVRSRVAKAVKILGEGESLPLGWVKAGG